MTGKHAFGQVPTAPNGATFRDQASRDELQGEWLPWSHGPCSGNKVAAGKGNVVVADIDTQFRCNNQLPSCLNCIQYGKECVYDELPKRPRPSFARLAALEEENKRLQEALRGESSVSQSSSPPRDAKSQSANDEGRSSRSSDQSPRRTASVDGEGQSGGGDVPPATAVPGTPIRSPLPERAEALSSPVPVPQTSTPELPPVPPPIFGAGSNKTGSVINAHSDSNSGSQRGGGRDTRYHGPTSTLFDDTAAREAHGRHRHAPQNHLGPSTYWVQKSLFAEAASQRHLETINLAAGKLDFDGVDPDLGMHLLSLHWSRQHHSFLITYRPAFMRDMACGGPYFSRLLLNAIFFGASKFSNRLEVRRDPNDVRTAGWLFRERVRQLLGSALDRSDITTIQALLVMTSSLFALGERSAAWLYAGTAFRMIIDLGMHVDGGVLQRGLTEEDVEIRRRLFWSGFVVDKIQSLYQGRPVSLQEIETSVPLAFNDEYEELEHWRPFAYAGGGTVAREYPGSPAYSVSCFTQLCRLSLVMNRILNALYAERSVKKKPEELAEDLKKLHGDLESWKAELPSHLDFDPAKAAARVAASEPVLPTPPPHVLSLLAMHYVLLILLHRPFVSDGHLHVNLRALSTSSFLRCAEAATAIVELLRAYNAAFSVRRAPYLISYATYVAATIHARIASQPRFATEAKEALAICLMVFEENSGTNWAVNRARAVIRGLMQRMEVSVEAADATTTTASIPTYQGARIAGRQEDERHQTPQRRQDAATIEKTALQAAESNRPEESTPSGANLERPGSVSNNEDIPGDSAPSSIATFDIDAIISSFISDQQPPLAAAFKSLPTPDDSQRPQQQGVPSYMGHISPHSIASYPSPMAVDQGCNSGPSNHYHNHRSHQGAWFGPATAATIPAAYQPMFPSHNLANSPSAPAVSLGSNNSGRFTTYNAHSALSSGGIQQNTNDGNQQGITVPGWHHLNNSGVDTSGGGQATNVHTSDLLFGFNSSVVDGIGWEFGGSGNY